MPPDHRQRANSLTHILGLPAVILLLTGATLPLSVSAEDIQDLKNIRQSVHDFALAMAKVPGQTTEVEVGTLDPRLRITRCAAKLEAFTPLGAQVFGSTTVGVRCQGAKPWTVYVPVRVKLYGEVLIAARPVAKGATLQEADIGLETRDMAAVPVTPLTDRQQVLGKLVKQPLQAGAIIAASELQAPRLIRRGERVIILATNGGLEIRANGEALMDGAEGDRIRVRNTLTKIVIQATVASFGVVRVPL